MLKTEIACTEMGNITIGGDSVDPVFVERMESLGYDVEVRLVSRGCATRSVDSGNARYHKQYLYKMTFPNGMVYIGTAWDVRNRWANRGAQYRGQKVWDAIKEFGWDNIEREILLYIPYDGGWGDKIRDEERRLIREYEGRCYNRQCTESFHREISDAGRAKGIYDPKIWWEIDGVRKPASEWCAEYGRTYSSAKRRMDKWGLTPKQALTFPVVPNKKGYSRDPMRYWYECGCFDDHKTEEE